jgi:hypothetical protein
LEATTKKLSFPDRFYWDEKKSYLKKDCIIQVPESALTVEEITKKYD